VYITIKKRKLNYMLISRHQNPGQNLNRSREKVAQLRYLGTIVTNRNLIHEEIKSKLKWVMFPGIHFGVVHLLACCLMRLGRVH
jgi:hypothetical protein